MKICDPWDKKINYGSKMNFEHILLSLQHTESIVDLFSLEPEDTSRANEERFTEHNQP